MHVYDQPGSQLDEAVKTVVKAFKWRKSYGVENLDDSALNRFFSFFQNSVIFRWINMHNRRTIII